MRKLVATAAAAALLASILAAPADARHRRHRHHDDVDAGDVVAGAVVVAGLAAILSSSAENRRRKQDAAVDACSLEAESRLGGRIAEVYSVEKSRGYYRVEGEVEGPDGRGLSVACTVRNGSIYSFREGSGTL